MNPNLLCTSLVSKVCMNICVFLYKTLTCGQSFVMVHFHIFVCLNDVYLTLSMPEMLFVFLENLRKHVNILL